MMHGNLSVLLFVPGALLACAGDGGGAPTGVGGAAVSSGGAAASSAGSSVSGRAAVAGGAGNANGSGGNAAGASSAPSGAGGLAGAGSSGAGAGGLTAAGRGGSSSGSGGIGGASGFSGGAGRGSSGDGGLGSSGAVNGGIGGGPSGGAGSGGAGAGGVAGSTIDTTLAGDWDGALLEFPCGNTHDAYNCANTNCTNNQTTKTEEWTIGGTAGAIYEVTFNVRGIVETTYYPNATRDGGSIKDNPDLFARGGNVQDSSGPSYDYNTYRLVVTPAVDGEPNTYFLNSVTMAENPKAASSPTTHVTFPINYTKTIKVTGGGKVTFSTFDSNCTFLQNCGPTQGSTCANPRTVALDGVSPAPPMSFAQPFEQPTGAFGQWVFFDVTKIVAAE